MFTTTKTKEPENPERFLQNLHDLGLCDAGQPTGFGRSRGSGGGGQNTWKKRIYLIDAISY